MTTLDDYVRIRDVDGVNPRLLARRVREGEIVGVRDPRDRRNVLVRRSDLAQLLAPGGGRSTLARADRAVELATV